MSALRDALAAGPRRLPLATVPTALHLAPRLSEHLGVPIWFKRDDLTGVGLGGNKIRTLEYLLADALDQGCDCLVTGAGPQSNWTMLAALTAIPRGLEPFVVCYGDPTPVWGNLQLHRRLGTTITWTGDPERTSVDEGMAAVAARLRRQGRRPYVVPRGGATDLGTLGYVRATVELADQLTTAGVEPRSLWLATGSGATTAGLVAGAALLPAAYDVVGVSVSRLDVGDRVNELARGAAAVLGLVGPIPTTHVRADWIGPGYGKASPEGEAAADLVSRLEGVFLDPVFAAKAMAALIDAARSLSLGGPTIFLVSGGAPTLFAPEPTA